MFQTTNQKFEHENGDIAAGWTSPSYGLIQLVLPFPQKDGEHKTAVQ